MKTRKIKYTGEKSIKPAATVIKNGGLVAFPTETVYGLGGNALDGRVAEKIYKAKGRPSDNPLIVHLADWHDADKYCITNELFNNIAEVLMPGPITVIMPKRDCIPYSVTGGLDTVGIRVPSHKVAHELIKLSGVPIAAPSANISGRPSPTRFSHIEYDLDGKVELLIDGGDCNFGVESTIIKLNGDEILLLRPGAVTIEMLSVFSKKITVDPAVTEKFDGVPMAPGMKYRHYAPKQPLSIIIGEDEKFYEFIRIQKDIGVICFDEDLPFIECDYAFSCGRSCDSLTQAHRLFACLREFDGLSNIKQIYARMPSKIGVGLAVFNRLMKASGYNVFRLK